MTRYARVGSSQQHKKLPGEATPWGEFSKVDKTKNNPKDDKIHKIQKGRIEKKKDHQNRKFGFENSKKDKVSETAENEDFSNKISDKDASSVNEMDVSDEKGLTKRQIQKARRKMKIFNRDIMRAQMAEYEAERNEAGDFSVEETPLIKEEIDFGDENLKEKKSEEEVKFTFPEGLSKRQLKRAKRKMKLQMVDKKGFSNSINNEVKQEDENVADDSVSSPSKSSKKKNKEAVSMNTVDTSENESLIKDQKDCCKTIDNAGGQNNKSMLNNDGNNSTEVKPMTMTKNQWRKARIKRKFELLKAAQAGEEKPEQDSEKKEVMPTTKRADNKRPVSSSEKDFEGKKKMYLEKLQRKRQQNGITLLPSKVERKIYNIKKKLREKGTSDESIREIVRKERRHEEIKFKRTFAKKPCFNCRQIGHLLSDCPLRLGDTKQATGICFKCGSTEHTSYKCTKRVEGYPLAKCFVCKEQGHVSKDCPKNERGVYIKGGKCSLCGNVNHLHKDCPTLKKEEAADMTVDTINDGMSVEAEIIKSETTPKKVHKKPKVVKF